MGGRSVFLGGKWFEVSGTATITYRAGEGDGCVIADVRGGWGEWAADVIAMPQWQGPWDAHGNPGWLGLRTQHPGVGGFREMKIARNLSHAAQILALSV